MATNYIWRDLQNPPDASTLEATDYIAFEITSTATSDQGHIHQVEYKTVVALADNEKPNAKLNEIQDTQLDSITITITGSLHLKKGDGSNATDSAIPQKVKQWMLDPKTTTSFPKGRFGLKMAEFTIFNVNPSNLAGEERGYLIQDWTWLRVGDTPGKAEFITTLRLNGTVGLSPYTSWTDEVSS